MKELNKKLAEWAGLKLAEEPDYTGFFLFADSDGICHTANFTDSLDACFKWLVPKLKEQQPELKISFMDNGERQGCAISRFEKLTSRKKNMQWIQKAGSFGETLALSLCLAIEKLIEEAKNENTSNGAR